VRRILGVAMDMLSPLHRQMYERLAETVSAYHAETEHTPILEALVLRDAPRARHAMRDHIKVFSKFISDTYGPEAEPRASEAQKASDSV
jgi:DNA-binding GntR family transcriptional regulator